MIASRYIIKLLTEKGVKYVFGVTGTAVNMCFVALGEQEGIDYICPLHEQAASMGADGYSRKSNSIGVALATSGPGTSNMLTGCAGAYTDSIPVLYIVGQAGEESSKGVLPIRFFGFQELSSTAVYKSVTKYCTTVSTSDRIRYEIEKALFVATDKRKGPVMLVFPENVLYDEVNVETQKGYTAKEKVTLNNSMLLREVRECYEFLKDAKRPLLLFGAGVHAGNAENEARELSRLIECPVGLSYPARDLMDDQNRLNVGSIGIFGSRGGNFAVQSADLLICVGLRMDKYITGNVELFSPHSKKCIVDIDEGELHKLVTIGIKADMEICSDSKLFLSSLLCQCRENEFVCGCSDWANRINEWKTKYPVCAKEFDTEQSVNPYVFIRELSERLTVDDSIFSDTGLSTIWIGQSFKFKAGQRWFTQFSYSSMGYALPGAFGASFATENRVICVTGDGGIQMSIQELSTVMFYQRKMKIFVICNEGYGLIQKTQDDFRNGHYATDRDNHVPLPNLYKVATSYSIKIVEILSNDEICEKLDSVLKSDEAVLCMVHIPIEKKITPRIRGKAGLENMFPYLTEETIWNEIDEN